MAEKVVSKRFGIPNSTSIDVYLQHEGYTALAKALKLKAKRYGGKPTNTMSRD